MWPCRFASPSLAERSRVAPRHRDPGAERCGRDWHFFGLRTPGHYYNFVVAHYANAPGSRSKYFVDPPVRVF